MGLRYCSRRFFATLLAAVLLFSSSACSSSDPSEALQKELKTIVSWIETARTVGQAWRNGAVPAAYAGRTFETAQQELQKETETIQTLSISESAKTDLSAKLQQLQSSLGQAALAIRNNDKSTFANAVNQLTTQQQELAVRAKGNLSQPAKP